VNFCPKYVDKNLSITALAKTEFRKIGTCSGWAIGLLCFFLDDFVGSCSTESSSSSSLSWS